MPTSNERKMLSSNEALKELKKTKLIKYYNQASCILKSIIFVTRQLLY